MKKTIRCCISCILPCGVLDVVRIVHANGRVDELPGTVTAADVLKAYPKHVLKKPSSSAASDDAVVPKIVLVPPEAELQKGKIYFLMPAPPPEKTARSAARKKRRDDHNHPHHHHHNRNNANAKKETNNNNYNYSNAAAAANVVVSDRYLTEILSEKVSTTKDRRRGRVAVWRPHLESISETPMSETL